MKSSIDELPLLVQELYQIINKLEKSFPSRPFTPDGHLVGSIGEVLASYYYGLELLPPSFEVHDAKNKDGRLIQIKATQGNSIGLRSNPDLLLVIKLRKDGGFEEIYNGLGSIVWENSGKMQKNGQRSININKLRALKDQNEQKDVLIRCF